MEIGREVAISYTISRDVALSLPNRCCRLMAGSPGRRSTERPALCSRLERACRTEDDLIVLLYRFFSLEALLSDKSVGAQGFGC